jgi:hypothetical protein
MFSPANFLNCGQDSNGPAGFSAGLLHSNERHTQRKKPCRTNNQFATSAAARQQRTQEEGERIG